MSIAAPRRLQTCGRLFDPVLLIASCLSGPPDPAAAGVHERAPDAWASNGFIVHYRGAPLDWGSPSGTFAMGWAVGFVGFVGVWGVLARVGSPAPVAWADTIAELMSSDQMFSAPERSQTKKRRLLPPQVGLSATPGPLVRRTRPSPSTETIHRRDQAGWRAWRSVITLPSLPTTGTLE